MIKFKELKDQVGICLATMAYFSKFNELPPYDFNFSELNILREEAILFDFVLLKKEILKLIARSSKLPFEWWEIYQIGDYYAEDNKKKLEDEDSDYANLILEKISQEKKSFAEWRERYYFCYGGKLTCPLLKKMAKEAKIFFELVDVCKNINENIDIIEESNEKGLKRELILIKLVEIAKTEKHWEYIFYEADLDSDFEKKAREMLSKFFNNTDIPSFEERDWYNEFHEINEDTELKLKQNRIFKEIGEYLEK